MTYEILSVQIIGNFLSLNIPYLVQNNVVGSTRAKLLRLQQRNVESVQEEILKVGGLVAHGTHPLRLLLVHAEVGVAVEALQVVAGRGPRWVGHPRHAQWTGHGNLIRHYHDNLKFKIRESK